MTLDELQALPVAAALMGAAPGSVTGGKNTGQELMLEIAAESIVIACRYLKAEQKFVRLSTVTAVDWYPEEPRFEVVYHLHSLERNERLRVARDVERQIGTDSLGRCQRCLSEIGDDNRGTARRAFGIKRGQQIEFHEEFRSLLANGARPTAHDGG